MTDPVRRFRSFDIKARDAASPEPKSVIRFVASTADPVSWGGWREVLKHEAAAVDVSATRALLLNHQSSMIAGVIRSVSFDGSQCEMTAEILPDARLESGVSVLDAIESGALRGISIGYRYDDADVQWEESTRTATVGHWRMLEASLTPIPADPTAAIRSAPSASKNPGAFASTQEPTMPDPIVPAPVADESVRAAVIAEQREIVTLAKSAGLDVEPYVGLRKADAQARMLADLSAARATPAPVAPVISGQVDQADKAREAFVGAMLGRANLAKRETLVGNPMAGRTILDAARQYASMLGIRGVVNWSRQDLAHFVLGHTDQISGFRDGAANVSVASFPSFVMLNAISKAVAAGFEMGSSSIKHQPLVSRKSVPDFRTFYIGGLGTGNLQKTAENIAFPELNKAEGVYSSTAKMWGGTLSLSLQALVNDDVGEFDRGLRNAGVIALKTIDKRVFQKLLMGSSAAEGTSTWTSNTTSGCTPVYTTGDTIAAARANINKASMVMMGKIGLDGNPLGNSAQFLVAGPTAGQYIQGLSAAVGGQSVGNGGGAIPQLIVSPWLELSTLTGYSTTSYYAVSDPNEVTGLVLSTITGMESPQVLEYDAGAVAARNWKIYLPFEADLFNFANAAGTTIIPGAQQATT